MKLDETDLKILKILVGDARLSFRKIAEQVGVSIGTVISKVKKFEESELIKGYSAILNHEKMSYTLTVITEVTVAKGKLLETGEEIAKIPNVCCVYDVTGLTDAIVIAKFKTREELSNFTKSLLKMPYIERTNTHLALTTLKEDFTLI